MENSDDRFLNPGSSGNSKINPKSEPGNNLVNEVNTICRLPSFWTTSPFTWFVQAEAQFNLHKIQSDRIKYYMVVASLSQEAIESILDVVQNPPEKDKYENVKKTLIDRHTISQERKIEKLISGEQMGDRKPSEFYDLLVAID